MTYVQKYYEELFLNSLNVAYNDGLISHDDEFITYVKSKQDISNFYVMNLSVFADSIDDVYYDMTDVYNSHKINLALGDDLDDLGDEIGCLRPQATYASVTLTFTTELYDTVKTIPSDIICSTKDGISYRDYTCNPAIVSFNEGRAVENTSGNYVQWATVLPTEASRFDSLVYAKAFVIINGTTYYMNLTSYSVKTLAKEYQRLANILGLSNEEIVSLGGIA